MVRISRSVGAAAAVIGLTGGLVGCDLGGSSPTATATPVVSASPSATPSAELNGGYLTASSTDARYFQFTETGTAITGSYDRTWEGASPQPPKAQNKNLSVSGSQAGTQLSLTLSDGTAVTGTACAGGTLTLAFPQANGALQNFTFAPATTDAFNSAQMAVQTNAASEDSLSYWMTQAQATGACSVAKNSGTYSSATLVGSDALSICESAVHAGFVSVAGVNTNATRVLCVYPVNSSRVGVTDGGGLEDGAKLCEQLAAMAFPGAGPS